MGETLNLAREKSAYTLSDRATFLAQGKPGLEVLVEGDPDLQNIYHVIMVKGLSGKEAELARKLMDYFTSAQTQERIASFSGGERQRVALARALAVGPDVLLLDEPTANLDPYNVAVIEQLIARVNREGATVVMVTHNVFQARRLCHRAALMLEGKLVEIGEKEEIFTRPRDPRTAAFVRGEMVY